MPRDMINHLDETYVKSRLESAGRTLMMLPSTGRPAGYKSNWPEHIREYLDTLDWTEEGLAVIIHDPPPVKLRPNMRQMNELNEVLDWLFDLGQYCKSREIPYITKAIWYGMLHHPISERRIYSWGRLSKIFRCDRKTVQRWYEGGIEIIVKNQNLLKSV